MGLFLQLFIQMGNLLLMNRVYFNNVKVNKAMMEEFMPLPTLDHRLNIRSKMQFFKNAKRRTAQIQIYIILDQDMEELYLLKEAKVMIRNGIS